MAAKSRTLHRMSSSFSSSRRVRGKPASSFWRASAWSAPKSRCSILKRCDLVGGYLRSEGKVSARSRNSRARRNIRHTSRAGSPDPLSSTAPATSTAPLPSAKRSGSSSNASADITAAAPVRSRQRSASCFTSMPPFAITGMPTARRTIAMGAQLGAQPAEPAGSCFAYFGRWRTVRPCTQRAAAPASSMAQATSSVAASVSRSRILAVTGTTRRPPAKVPTMRCTCAVEGRRYAPYLRHLGEWDLCPPMRASSVGQPKLMSTAST
mmetsp:Transcript_30770/g.92492  ORF Transcript_30770/g.92492 Transcript_30770/m.92492 type:complete len:266 (-) Transcript_30770:17-814(-)